MAIYNPQDLLDEINDIDVPGVFALAVPTPKERLTRIKLVRQELRIAKKRLKAEQDAIKKRWDNRKRGEAEQERLELIPYNLVEAHMDTIEAALVKMEAALKLGEPLPPAPPDDLVIVGSVEYGQYMLMTIPEAAAWEREQKAKVQTQLKQHFGEARQLIDRKQYAAARQILQIINHPQAREWLNKVDRLEQTAIAAQRRKNRRRFVGCVTFLVVLIIFAGLAAVLQRSQQPEQIAALPTAIQFNTVTSLPITPQFEPATTSNSATLDAGVAQDRRATEAAMIDAALTEIGVTRAASIAIVDTLLPSATITDTALPSETATPTQTATPAQQVTPFSLEVWYVKGIANARSCPDTECDLVGKFQQGEMIGIDGAIDGILYSGSTIWYRTSYQGQIAFVHSSLISSSVPPPPQPTAARLQPTAPISVVPGFTCNCSKTCPQMVSCEEAYFQLQQCGCSERDGDSDGVPCESICPGG